VEKRFHANFGVQKRFFPIFEMKMTIFVRTKVFSCQLSRPTKIYRRFPDENADLFSFNAIFHMKT
jgi:hypothetical protein